MPETPPSGYQDRRRLVVYELRPTTLLGRALAFVLGVLLLIAAFFFSLVIFMIVATAMLFLIFYALWMSRR